MKKELFSAIAWKSLQRAEKLDEPLAITSEASWMALSAVAILVVSVVMWALWGVMSTTVDGSGIIIDAGGVSNVFHDSSGIADEILVEIGGKVKQGDVIARLRLSQLDNEITISEENLQLSGDIKETLHNLYSLDSLVSQRSLRQNIISPTDGVVSDIHINVGDFVAAGDTAVCSIRQDYQREDLAAMLYVPLENGKRVAPGMMVQLSPSEAEVKETGYLLGVVRSVSLYPVSTAGIVKKVGDAEVAKAILANSGGAAMEVRVELLINAESGSGYQWTAIVGTPPEISPGSFCSAKVVVERQAPLQRLFFKFNKWLRLF